MGKIVVSQNVTLDGVVEDPSGEGGFKHGGWFRQFMGQDWEAWAELELAEAQGAEALLMGRRSDEYFGARSSIMSGEWVDSLNRLPKYVVSATLHRAQMDERDRPGGRGSERGLEAQATDTGGDRRVRQPPARAHADGARPGRRAAPDSSSRLCSARASACSARPATSDPCAWSSTKTVGNGLAHLTYERAREA